MMDQPQLNYMVPNGHPRSKGRELPIKQTMESCSYPRKFTSKPFSLGIHMTQITHKADIHILGDWLESPQLGDLNVTTITTMTIALERFE